MWHHQVSLSQYLRSIIPERPSTKAFAENIYLEDPTFTINDPYTVSAIKPQWSRVYQRPQMQWPQFHDFLRNHSTKRRTWSWPSMLTYEIDLAFDAENVYAKLHRTGPLLRTIDRDHVPFFNNSNRSTKTQPLPSLSSFIGLFRSCFLLLPKGSCLSCTHIS